MSMRAAINAKCKDCIYDPLAGGTWRQQVEGCAIKSCGLWPYRPKSSVGKAQASSPENGGDLAPETELAACS